MTMKRTFTIALLVAGAALASATSAAESYQQGRVLSAIPIYETVRVPTSREVCWDEEVRYRRRPSAGSTLVGGVIGGAVGRQFGGGSGTDIMTAVGAIVGASVANDVSRNRHGDYTRVETQCRVANEYYQEERITGYRVNYEYNGQVYTTRTDREPGEYIELRVSVSPVE
jgi:uncharacterized protein YcfJ